MQIVALLISTHCRKQLKLVAGENESRQLLFHDLIGFSS